MADIDSRQTIYALYLATAEKVSDRRQQTHAWMLSVNSALVALLGLVGAGKAAEAADAKRIWLVAIPVAGILVCLAWVSLLESYRKLNMAKFTLLQEIERDFSIPLFTREREIYKAQGRSTLTHVESWIPWVFAFLYGFLAAAPWITF